jgi:hypothetical protein
MANSTSTVYILGAGFSKSFHPTVIPLMRDFLHTASKMGKYEIDGRHRDLSRLIYRYFGDTRYHDIEKVMSFLSPSTPDDPSLPLQNRQVLYDQFLSLINETLSWIHLQSPSKLVEDRYAKFAEHLVSSQSSVVSFNYDLLLDQLLYKTGKWIGYVDTVQTFPLLITLFHTSGVGVQDHQQVIPLCCSFQHPCNVKSTQYISSGSTANVAHKVHLMSQA